jgi:Biopolymer transport proteins
MEIISKALFWVANSLLIPDIIILLSLLGRSLMLLGSFYNQFMVKRRNDREISHRVKSLSSSSVEELRKALPERDNSLFMRYMRDLLSNPPSEAYSDYLISKFENDAEKDIAVSKLLAKMGPILGLIGTLIAMSPALVGLSTGDIAGMAYNMQVVFATTVVGLVISAIGIVTLQFKQRWYAKDVNNLDYVSRVLTGNMNSYELQKTGK